MPEVLVQAPRRASPCFHCPSGCSYIFQGLSPADWIELEAIMHPIEVGAGELIFRERLPALGLYVICQGKVKLAKHGPSGRSQILKLLGPREILGEKTLFDRETYTCYAKALEPSRLVLIPRDDFLAFTRRHPAVALRLIDKLSRELKVFGDKLVEITSRSAKERLARVLLELARAFGHPVDGGVDIGVELPRNELAEMASVTTETAIRTLSELRDLGIISLPGRRIIILKEEAIQTMAHPFRTFLRENLI